MEGKSYLKKKINMYVDTDALKEKAKAAPAKKGV